MLAIILVSISPPFRLYFFLSLINKGNTPVYVKKAPDRQLHPVAVAFHRLEDVAPAFRFGYVVGDDVEALRGHVGYRGR